jgi:hypothetical protein
MQLEEIDTLQDLKVWVSQNMPGAYVEGEGEVTIRTGLIATMGGYLHPIEGEDK